MSNLPNEMTGRLKIVLILSILLVFVTQLLLVMKPEIGMFANAISLTFILYFAVTQPYIRKLNAAISIIPTLNIVALTFQGIAPPIHAGMNYLLIIILALIYGHLSSHASDKVTYKNYALTFSTMLLLGGIICGAGYTIFPHAMQNKVPLYLIVGSVPLIAWIEVLLFQQTIQHDIQDSTSKLDGITLATFLYASLFFNADLRVLAIALLSGLLISCVYIYKRNLLVTSLFSTFLKLTIIVLHLYFASSWLSLF